jgi:hypothetical protein
VADYMAEMGMTQEPLIHSKATIGSGAYYKKGKTPGRIAYLEDADFAVLEAALMYHVGECLAG